jgi:hypothetical protein
MPAPRPDCSGDRPAFASAACGAGAILNLHRWLVGRPRKIPLASPRRWP